MIKKLIALGLGFFMAIQVGICATGVATNALELAKKDRDSENPNTAITLRWENDVIAGTDENYSNGISLSLARRGRGLFGKIWDWLGAEDVEYYHSYELGQIINTPANKDLEEPDPLDRPYSGLLYAGLATQIRKGNNFHGLKFVTGVVGPPSLAKETQIWWHRIIGSSLPKGWSHQLHTEPIFNLVYEYRYKYNLFTTENGISSDLIPIGGIMAGNVLDQLQLGLQTRIGWHIPDEFGTTILRGMGNLTLPKYTEKSRLRKFGFYFFGDVGMRIVARDLQLEGNSFRDSPGVDINHFVPIGEAGVTIYFGAIQITASYVATGKEFDRQLRDSNYGTIALTVLF